MFKKKTTFVREKSDFLFFAFYSMFFTCCSDGGMVDTQDLKSCDHCGCAGSSPAPSTCKTGALVPTTGESQNGIS